MVESSCDILPVVEVVTLLALRTQPSLMWILMAGSAGLGDAAEGPIQILHLDERAVARRNVLGRVAFLTFDPCVLSFQQVARLFMIKGLRVEFRNREIEPVVVGMTLGAFLAGAGPETVGEVQAFVSREAPCDLGVAFQALKVASPPASL
jgi:hypothetical protein